MTTLVIGGDKIASIKRELSSLGYHDVEHWHGRNPAHAHREVPKRTKLVVMMIDQLNHSLLKSARIDVEKRGLPIVYCKRSVSQLREKIGALKTSAEGEMRRCQHMIKHTLNQLKQQTGNIYGYSISQRPQSV